MPDGGFDLGRRGALTISTAGLGWQDVLLQAALDADRIIRVVDHEARAELVFDPARLHRGRPAWAQVCARLLAAGFPRSRCRLSP